MKKLSQNSPVRKTAECVSPAHPDKLCDQISDMILDACLAQDPWSRVACEVMWSHGKIRITWEITTDARVDYQQCARDVLRLNRYDPTDYEVDVHMSQQSSAIARGVDTGGAGDQGIMIGYATRETNELIPLELQLSRSILQDLRELSPLTRDAKAQVTTCDGQIESLVVSAERLDNIFIRQYLEDRFGTGVTYHINASWPWSDGGFSADAGLTGRKLAVDNYGPQIPIGGGAFSGKDWSKVDRSGAYIARYIACDYLRQHTDIQRAQVSIAYCIGVAEPVMVSIQTDQGVVVYESELDLTPHGIRDFLDLTCPQFVQTARWGHFGHEFVREK